MVNVINLETLVLKHQMGKQGGTIHKGKINGCCITLLGDYVATCGDDKRIIVWSLKTLKPVKLLDQHNGEVFQVEFSPNGDFLYSAGADGIVNIFEWRSGAVINSCMRHSAAVRSFDFNYDNMNLCVCGQTDGSITVWNTQHSLRIDNIIPDPQWTPSKGEASLIAWADKHKNHTGAILTTRLSANHMYLASGAADNTCKLWMVTSYRKELDYVQRELKETEKHYKNLRGYIDILDESYNEQLEFKEFTLLKIGEVPLDIGYHADLKFTFRHDAPVLAVRFTTDSNLVITGSMDSTCRLWSTKRGEQLFQINLPAPITHIQVDLNENIYCSCLNRLVVFTTKALYKEQDLPTFWQHSVFNY
jgi:WD40 repeat protein